MPGCTSRLLPKALSHANRWLLLQQFTAMCLLKMTRERISGWLSVMLKVSYAGAAGILSPMPANNLMYGSPVKGFSDNKRHSFHPSGRVFSGRRGFFIYSD